MYTIYIKLLKPKLYIKCKLLESVNWNLEYKVSRLGRLDGTYRLDIQLRRLDGTYRLDNKRP